MTRNNQDDDNEWVGFRAAMKERRQNDHAIWKSESTKLIVESNIPHKIVNDGEAILFREHNKPRVDFYPSTGRAKVDNGRTRSFGGAANFLIWYQEQ